MTAFDLWIIFGDPSQSLAAAHLMKSSRAAIKKMDGARSRVCTPTAERQQAKAAEVDGHQLMEVSQWRLRLDAEEWTDSSALGRSSGAVLGIKKYNK